MTHKERLEKIQKVHLERIKQNEFYTASFIHVDWLVEQVEKAQRYEKALKEIASREGDFYEDELALIAKEALES